MVTLRQLLRWSFALVVITVLPATISLTIESARTGDTIAPRVRYWFLAIIVAVSLVFAMACWTTRKPRSRPSRWAIAASLMNTVAGAAFLCFAPRLPRAAAELALMAAGIAGLIVFTRREELPDPVTAKAKSARTAGDCTSPWLDRIITLLFCTLAYAASRIWSEWSGARTLPASSAVASIGLILLAILATSILHELGHAVVGWSFRMKLLAFNAGPFLWRRRKGRWSFSFQASGLVQLGGSVGIVPTDSRQPRWHDVCTIAAGPVANVFVGVIALMATLHAEGTAYASYWEFLARLTSFCFIAAVLNLFPFRAEGGAYSDGARILQLFTHSPVASLHRAIIGVQSTLVTSRRMRDLDAPALQQAAKQLPHSLTSLQLHLSAARSYEDSGRIPEACAALAAAEDVYNEFRFDLPVSLHATFIYGHAKLNRDAAAARLWWERMCWKKPEEQCADYWLARTALLWVENRYREAEHAWRMADTETKQLPELGAYEYDRDRAASLREELDLTSPTLSRPAVIAGPRYTPKPKPLPFPARIPSLASFSTVGNKAGPAHAPAM